MPNAWFGPVQDGAAYVSPVPQPGETPTARALFRHYGTMVEGRNVYILTDGSVTENDPTDWTLVAHVLWGGHYETVTDAEAVLLTAAGYGAYLS